MSDSAFSDPTVETRPDAKSEVQSETQTGVAALDELFKPVERSAAPGLVVGVAQHGKLRYRRGFGLASVELGVANMPRTRMRIGSTSKHFTFLGVLLLAEAGERPGRRLSRRHTAYLPHVVRTARGPAPHPMSSSTATPTATGQP